MKIFSATDVLFGEVSEEAMRQFVCAVRMYPKELGTYPRRCYITDAARKFDEELVEIVGKFHIPDETFIAHAAWKAIADLIDCVDRNGGGVKDISGRPRKFFSKEDLQAFLESENL